MIRQKQGSVSISGKIIRKAHASLALAVLLQVGIVAVPCLQAQPFSTFYTFMGSPNGAYPYGPLIRDAKGRLYGTTSAGGLIGCDPVGCGTVFRLDSTGAETVLYRFTGGLDGGLPIGGLIRDATGLIYGTASCCGANGHGVVFKLDKAGAETVLYSFTGGTDGSEPEGGLVRDNAGNLYGTTVQGGDLNCNAPYGCGTVFKLDSTGVLTVLHAFTGGADGASPFLVTLVRDKNNDIYGTTSYGGSVGGGDGHGVVFKIDPAGTETVLYRFAGGTDGFFPTGTLVRDHEGNLWGTTNEGGTYGYGTVFKFSRKEKETVLYSFTGGADGAYPVGGVLRSKNGTLYGTAAEGGSYPCFNRTGCGTVFQLDVTGKETTLHEFTGSGDGWFPWANLIGDGAGNLYGTTLLNDVAPAGCCGTVFKITP